MEEKNLLYSILIFQLLEYFWELYLSIRQHLVYGKTEKVPQDLENVLTHETFTKARLYAKDKSCFGIIKGIYGTILSTAMLIFYLNHYFWVKSEEVIEWIGWDVTSEITVSLTFVLISNLISTVINLPFSIYYTFVLEEKHGFNKQTAGFYVKDQIKKFVVGQVISLPLIAGIVYIVQWGGDMFFVYLWMFATIFMLLLMTVYPDYIAPLFDKYTPLPKGELRTRIEQLAASVKFPLYKLYVVEGSKRSVHSNAYFYGFFKNKRIVLFDTLLADFSLPKDNKDEGNKDENDKDALQEKDQKKKKGCSNDEVLAVLAHEIGHWKLNHVAKNIAIMEINLFLMLAAFGFIIQWEPMYRAFGFYNEQPILVGMIIAMQYIFSPYNSILNFLMTVLSRSFEFQADNYAVKLGHSTKLASALIKLNEDNLSFPIYDRLYSAWHHSHPPLLERLAAIKDKKSN